MLNYDRLQVTGAVRPFKDKPEEVMADDQD